MTHPIYTESALAKLSVSQLVEIASELGATPTGDRQQRDSWVQAILVHQIDRRGKQMETPRIYAACLSAYNAGSLHGKWIDCDQDSDDIIAEIQSMLSDSPMNEIEVCEEWAIHDYENFHGIKINEYESIERVAELAAAIEEHGEAFAAYVEHYGDTNIDQFEKHYYGSYENKRAFTEEHYSELLERVSAPQGGRVEEAGLNLSYVDFETLERDLFQGDFTGVRKDWLSRFSGDKYCLFE